MHPAALCITCLIESDYCSGLAGEVPVKREATPGFLWHLNDAMLVFQITIVTTVNRQGQVNAAPFGLVFPFCSSAHHPQMLLCSNSMWHTARNIEATGEFILNYAPYGLLEKVVHTGLMFSEGINELERAGLTAIPGLRVKPPRIEECYQHIECRLNRIIRPGDQQVNFIGDILSISLDEALCERGRLDMVKAADPLFLFGIDVARMEGSYGRLGQTTTYAPPTTDAE